MNQWKLKLQEAYWSYKFDIKVVGDLWTIS